MRWKLVLYNGAATAKISFVNICTKYSMLIKFVSYVFFLFALVVCSPPFFLWLVSFASLWRFFVMKNTSNIPCDKLWVGSAYCRCTIGLFCARFRLGVSLVFGQHCGSLSWCWRRRRRRRWRLHHFLQFPVNHKVQQTNVISGNYC